MKCQISLLLLLASLLCLCLSQSFAHAERTAAQHLKLRRGSFFNEPALARSSEAAAVAAEKSAGAENKQSDTAAAGATASKDASSGRLFLKKFLTFKNMFGSNNQPVIPIIITGAGTGDSLPTTVFTSSGVIPTLTGTGSFPLTSPPTTTTLTGSPTATAVSPVSRQYGNEQQDDEQGDADEAEDQAQPAAIIAANAELLDEQTLQAAIAAGAQEYEVFSEGDQASNGGATESKASQNNRINLRRKGGRRGQSQTISVRIPPRYRRYFKDGQKVMLNTKNRINRRRVVRRRVQNKNKRFNNRRRGGKNKNKKNKNKRPRITVQ